MLYEVTNLNKVDTTRYKEGDTFKTNQTYAVLLNGKMTPFLFKQDIQKMINQTINRKIKELNKEDN